MDKARRILKRLAIIIVILIAVVYGALWLRWPLAAKPIPGPEAGPHANWWDNPRPMSQAEAEALRFISSVTWQLPPEESSGVWSMGGRRQTGVSSIRYHAAFAGYAAALAGMHTPACPELTAKIMRSLIARMLDKFTWHYVEYYWRQAPTFPDPVAFENIMYSGHLLHLLAYYEAITGDDRYRTAGFDFVWDESTRIHYDTMKLAETIAGLMRSSDCGGVCCEPGLVFFPCNNHPQVGLLALEAMGYGNWEKERRRWEEFALSGFGTIFGGGAFKLLYMPRYKIFVPRGVPGLDGWSVLWYYPWASDPERVGQVWKRTAGHIDWTAFSDSNPGLTNIPLADCCGGMGEVPAAVVAAFDFPAAVCAGDDKSAALLKGWLERFYLERTNGLAYIRTEVKGKIASTANYLIGLSLVNGADSRALARHPLPRDYFETGPWIESVLPEDATIYCAHRAGSNLMVELEAPGEVVLRLKNMPAVRRVEGVAESAWKYSGPELKITLAGRKKIMICR
ncbi:MAG: hypothetical protein WC299_03330 [Kiritimatiellia bacterium]